MEMRTSDTGHCYKAARAAWADPEPLGPAADLQTLNLGRAREAEARSSLRAKETKEG